MPPHSAAFKIEKSDCYLVFAEREFGPETSKTANLLLRYRPELIGTVVDSTSAGRNSSDILGSGYGEVPIVRSVEDGMECNPTHLVIGIAPTGGQLPESWREFILRGIKNGLHVVSGLHEYLSDDDEFSTLAEEHEVEIFDLRKPPAIHHVSEGKWRDRSVPVVQTIGSDSAVGKLTGAWELKRQLEKRGYQAELVATGQTGILLNGSGVVIDALKGDFMSATVEKLIDEAIRENPDIILVEGQGSIYHEAYSGVTLAILHGAMPDSFLFMHRPGLTRNDYGFKLPPIRDMLNDYETFVEWFKPANILGIGLDTSKYESDTAESMCREIEHITGITATDLVRFPQSEAVDEMIEKLHL